MIQIIRKKRVINVVEVRVGDLDKNKCSEKFLSHNLDDNTMVYVKCNAFGEFDLRGNKKEYRIIVPDKTE